MAGNGRKDAMAKVKLKHNLIIGGKHLNRGQIVDEEILTPLLRGDEYVTRNLDHKEGKVLLLQNVQYTTDEVDARYGQRVGYPISLSAGEVVDLQSIPERQRQDWIEGREYKSDWSEKER